MPDIAKLFGYGPDAQVCIPRVVTFKFIYGEHRLSFGDDFVAADVARGHAKGAV